MKNILLVSPLAYEARPVIKRLQQNYGSKISVTTLTVGVGPKKSAKRLSEFLSQEPDWDLILCVGLGGSLSSDLKAGDWVTPESIMTETGETLFYQSINLPGLDRFLF